MAQAPLAKAQLMSPLAHPLTTGLDPATGVEKGLEPLGAPKTHVVAHLARTLAHHLLERRAIGRVQSPRATRNRCTLQSRKSLLIDRVYPQANGVFIAV